MANASAKRVAQQNGSTIKNLKVGMLVSGALSFVFRLLFRRDALSPATFSFWIYVFSMAPSIFLSTYLERIGSPRRDPTTNTLLSSGEDLGRPGIIEWCFDVIYVTWACQIGSGAFGQWVWWFYMIIPAYAVFKLWTTVISPFVLGRSTAPSTEQEVESSQQESLSKRQEKLRKRNERGDPRVRMQQSKRRELHETRARNLQA